MPTFPEASESEAAVRKGRRALTVSQRLSGPESNSHSQLQPTEGFPYKPAAKLDTNVDKDSGLFFTKANLRLDSEQEERCQYSSTLDVKKCVRINIVNNPPEC